MNTKIFASVAVATALISKAVNGQECVPPPGGKCLTLDQYEKIKEALRELDEIKKSEMKGDFLDEIIIIHDWDGRVYVNGGSLKPLRVKVTLGTIDRTLAVTLPTSVAYREKPPDPMFRLRIRAQGGILLPDIWKGGERMSFLDGGIGWDFFHIGPVNLDIYTGFSSAGPGIGLDISKNFGVRAGYSLIYRDFHSGVMVGSYFSFNLAKIFLNA